MGIAGGNFRVQQCAVAAMPFCADWVCVAAMRMWGKKTHSRPPSDAPAIFMCGCCGATSAMIVAGVPTCATAADFGRGAPALTRPHMRYKVKRGKTTRVLPSLMATRMAGTSLHLRYPDALPHYSRCFKPKMRRSTSFFLCLPHRLIRSPHRPQILFPRRS